MSTRAKTKRYASVAALEEAGVMKASSGLEDVQARYAVGLNENILSAMESAGDESVIAKQYLPDEAELITTPDEDNDPIGDGAHSPVKGIVHRYPDRVLLKITHLCAVYCRFCFRREMVGPGQNDERMTQDDVSGALDYIAGNKDIFEVILTGGDPLSLSPRQLAPVFEALEDMAHVKIIRLHTRVPIADPARITDELLDALPKTKACYMCLHINHAAELTEETRRAVRLLHGSGCTLLSQSVLLKDVNDDPHILELLYRELLALHVKPYYLHHPDKARGTSHFRLSLKRGKMIVSQLLGRLSGIAQPHYMLDIPGGFGKVAVNSNNVRELAGGLYEITDFEGRTHLYKD